MSSGFALPTLGSTPRLHRRRSADASLRRGVMKQSAPGAGSVEAAPQNVVSSAASPPAAVPRAETLPMKSALYASAAAKTRIANAGVEQRDAATPAIVMRPTPPPTAALGTAASQAPRASLLKLQASDLEEARSHEQRALAGRETLARLALVEAERDSCDRLLRGAVSASLREAQACDREALSLLEWSSRSAVETEERDRFELVCGIRQRQLTALMNRDLQSREAFSGAVTTQQLSERFSVAAALRAKMDRDLADFFVVNREELRRQAETDAAILMDTERLTRSWHAAQEADAFSDLCLVAARGAEKLLSSTR